MAFCAACGAPVEGLFCAKCGNAVATATPSMGAPQSAGVPPPTPAAAGVMPDNSASALCYALGFITGIIFLVLAPYNQNRLVKFHAFQSIFFSVAFIIISWGLSFFLGGIFGFWAMLMFVGLIRMIFFVVWLFVIISTYQGKMIVLPVVGQIARQQAGL